MRPVDLFRRRRRRARIVGLRSVTPRSLLGALLLFGLLALFRSSNGNHRGLVVSAAAADDDLFSSNVVTLTSSNWKEHVLDNPHMVLVNICRKGWGYCQLLQPEWEKLAASVGGVATIAYWDTQGRSRPPRLLGSYEGTPTIRLFKPKRKPKTPGNNAEKTVVDYRHGERKASDLRRFLENQMPEFVERVRFGKEDYDRLLAKADRFGLPVALVFSSKAKTSTTTKWLSAEFRRRMLVVEVPPTDKNRGLLEAIAGGVSSPGESGDLPALYVVAEGKEVVKYGGGGFARRKLRDFLSRHALSEPVKGPAGGRQEEKKKKKEEAFSGGDEF